MSWQTSAACRDADPALFFGPDTELPAERDAREAKAKAVCASCLVRGDCAADADGISHGVWGGFGEEERRLMSLTDLLAGDRVGKWRMAGVLRIAANEKTCRRCRETKALDDFPVEKRSSDGRYSRCSTCVSAANSQRQRERRRQRREAIAA